MAPRKVLSLRHRKQALLEALNGICFARFSFSLTLTPFFCYLVVYDGCPKAFEDGIWWPRTMFGGPAATNCPKGSSGTLFNQIKNLHKQSKVGHT